MISGAVITIFSLIILLFSVIIHELAHGYVAYALGDPTAKYEGRLTLNPLKHLDPFGSVLLPLLLSLPALAGQPTVILGWAKPVPINPNNFKDQRWGSLRVALAGPLSNIALALVFGLLIRFAPSSLIAQSPYFFVIPLLTVSINLMLAFFNLLPIPPLDGHWILFAFLPRSFEPLKIFLSQYGFFLLIMLLFFNGLSFLYTWESIIAYLIGGENWLTILQLLTL